MSSVSLYAMLLDTATVNIWCCAAYPSCYADITVACTFAGPSIAAQWQQAGGGSMHDALLACVVVPACDVLLACIVMPACDVLSACICDVYKAFTQCLQ